MSAVVPAGLAAVLQARTGDELQARLHEVLPLYASIELCVHGGGELVECSVPLSEHNRNHLGTMHAGVLWSAAEAVGGLAYFSHVEELGVCWIAVREMTIRFLRPATTDVVARTAFGTASREAIRAQLDETGRADFELEIELLDAAGSVVATATGGYALRRPATGLAGDDSQ